MWVCVRVCMHVCACMRAITHQIEAWEQLFSVEGLHRRGRALNFDRLRSHLHLKQHQVHHTAHSFRDNPHFAPNILLLLLQMSLHDWKQKQMPVQQLFSACCWLHVPSRPCSISLIDWVGKDTSPCSISLITHSCCFQDEVGPARDRAQRGRLHPHLQDARRHQRHQDAQRGTHSASLCGR